jgi:O-acetyl-ADP-ribose deacetylase
MHATIQARSIDLQQGDITLQQVDAIVNAANSGLAGGGGGDGAIHRRGGPEIMRDTNSRYPEGCPTGSAVISSAGKLNAKHVIHAVGPVWSGGQRGEAELLAGAYRRSLELAAQHDCRSIALPALSTGVYRFPMQQAARIAISTAIAFLRHNDRPELVRFVLYDSDAYGVFTTVLQELAEGQASES